jgi:hypothetical protein
LLLYVTFCSVHGHPPVLSPVSIRVSAFTRTCLVPKPQQLASLKAPTIVSASLRLSQSPPFQPLSQQPPVSASHHPPLRPQSRFHSMPLTALSVRPILSLTSSSLTRIRSVSATHIPTSQDYGSPGDAGLGNTDPSPIILEVPYHQIGKLQL